MPDERNAHRHQAASGRGSAATRDRRPRGSLDPATTTAVFARVGRPAKDALDAIADASGKSIGVVLEELILRTELDDDGIPLGWTLPTSRAGSDLTHRASA